MNIKLAKIILIKPIGTIAPTSSTVIHVNSYNLLIITTFYFRKWNKNHQQHNNFFQELNLNLI